MKKLLLLFLIGTAPLYSQSWIAQESGTTADLHDVYCITPDIVVAVGNSGTILKTTDSGENWTAKPSGTVSHLSKVQFANSQTGYAIGSDGTILKTSDAAESWLTLNADASIVTDISCVSGNVFFITSGGWLKKSNNGGSSFETVNTTQQLQKIQFLTEQKGFASSDENLLKTTDGGVTWSIVKEGYVDSFYFLTETTGFVYTSTNGNFKTTDGSLTFSPIGFSDTRAVDLFALSEDSVWEVNGLFQLCGCPPEFCIAKRSILTNNESEKISNCNLSGNPDFMLSAVHFANPTTGFAVGATGYQNPMNPNGPKGAIYKNSTGEMQVQSVGENNKDVVKLFPNPASGEINVLFPDNLNQRFAISIIDYLGKTVLSANDMSKIDLTQMAPGVYFAKIITGNGISVQKFIRK